MNKIEYNYSNEH